MTNNHKLWVERYRPTTIDDYIFQNPQHKACFLRMIADESIPHLLLSGGAGSGKTTMARILIQAMGLDETDVLTINASDERGIDVFRETIKSFATSFAMGRFKIIHLEEADQLTPAAQMALKGFMEDVSDYVRFILTCNHVNKVIGPIRSRCQEFFFKSADINDVAERMIEILANERVKFNLDVVDEYIAAGYPDNRSIIGSLQQNTINGVLQRISEVGAASEYKTKLLDLLIGGDWNAARKLVCGSVTSDEWENLFRFMYDNVERLPKLSAQDKWEEAIIVIAEHLYKHSIVADPEINVAAMFIRLGQI